MITKMIGQGLAAAAIVAALAFGYQTYKDTQMDLSDLRPAPAEADHGES